MYFIQKIFPLFCFATLPYPYPPHHHIVKLTVKKKKICKIENPQTFQEIWQQKA